MEKSGKFRLTSLERNWILYDVGNSAFVLMVYFRKSSRKRF